MKDELLKQMIPILKMTKDSLISGVDVLIKETPQFVSEIYQYSIFVNIVCIFVFCIAFVGLYKFCFFSIKKHKENEYDSWELAIGLSVFLGLLSIVFSVMSIVEIVKIIIAPRLFLVDYISHILN